MTKRWSAARILPEPSQARSAICFSGFAMDAVNVMAAPASPFMVGRGAKGVFHSCPAVSISVRRVNDTKATEAFSKLKNGMKKETIEDRREGPGGGHGRAWPV